MKSGMHINDVIADCNDMRILLSKLKEEPLTYDNVALIKSFVAKYDKQHLGSVLECAQEHSKIEYLSELTHMICELFNEEIIKIRINEFREYCEKEYGELQWDESLPSNDCYNQYIKITSAINKYQKIAESHDTTNASKRKTAIAFIGTMQLDCKFNNFQKVIAICKEINMSCEIYVKDKINNKNEHEVSKRKAQEKQSQEEKTTIHIGTINYCNNNNKDYILLDINEKTVNNNTQVNNTQVNKTQVNNTQVNNTQVNNTQVNNTQVNNTQVNNTQVNNTQVNNTQVNNTQVNNTQVNKTQVNKTQVNKTQVNKTQVNKTQVNKTQVNNTLDNTKKYAANKSEEETKANTTGPKNSDKEAKKDNKEQIPDDRKNKIELSDGDQEELEHISKELHSLLCLTENAPFARYTKRELTDYLSLREDDYCGFVKKKQRAMTALWHIQIRLTNKEWLNEIMRRIGFEENYRQHRYDSIGKEIDKLQTLKELKKNSD